MITAGLLLLGVGLGWLAFARPDGTYTVDVLPASLVAALGMALAFVPSLGSAIAAAPPTETGVASGLVSTSYQVGSALGLAILTAIAAGITRGDATPAALTSGYSAAFLGAAIIAVIGAAVVLLTMRTSNRPVTSSEASAA